MFYGPARGSPDCFDMGIVEHLFILCDQRDAHRKGGRNDDAVRRIPVKRWWEVYRLIGYEYTTYQGEQVFVGRASDLTHVSERGEKSYD